MTDTNATTNAAREAGQLTIVSEFLESYKNSDDPNSFYNKWEGKLSPEQLDEALAEYSRTETDGANVRHFRRFILGEHEMPIISTGPKRKLTRAEKAFMGPEDHDAHSED